MCAEKHSAVLGGELPSQWGCPGYQDVAGGIYGAHMCEVRGLPAPIPKSHLVAFEHTLRRRTIAPALSWRHHCVASFRSQPRPAE